MDEPPQALSPLPTASHVVRFSSPFNFVPLVLGLFLFCFLERMWSCLILWVFCVFVSQENFWVYGLLEIGLVTVFMSLFSGLFMVWFLGFIFWFSGDGDWIWLLDLDLGFARDWFGCFLDLGRT